MSICLFGFLFWKTCLENSSLIDSIFPLISDTLNVFNKLWIIILIMIQPVQRMMFIQIVRSMQMKVIPSFCNMESFKYSKEKYIYVFNVCSNKMMNKIVVFYRTYYRLLLYNNH